MIRLAVIEWPLVRDEDTGQHYLAVDASGGVRLAVPRQWALVAIDPLETTMLAMLAEHLGLGDEDDD